MARVKVCRLCGRHNGPDELFCTGADCGTSLADVGVVDGDATADGAAPDGAPDGPRVGAADGPRDGAADGSGASRRDPPANAEGHTVRDGRPPSSCALVFPWGRVPVAGRLDIGREAGFSPISARLDAFPTVSRRHAVVGGAQDGWTVRDLGSTNGTWVNGARLPEGGTRAIHGGDRVGFSQGLQVQVEIAAAGEGGGGG